jgi:hypothetical protein
MEVRKYITIVEETVVREERRLILPLERPLLWQ